MITMEDLRRKLAHPRPGGAILFLGAGFSDGATNSRDLPVPLAKDFAAELSQAIGENSSVPLTILSEIYQEQNGDPLALVKLIKSTFSIKSITEQQRKVLNYPWKRIYTTNYDDVAEHVAAPNGTRPRSFSRASIPLTFEGDDRHIVHINGYVGAIDSETTIDDFALTFTSYIDSNLFASGWAATLRQDFLLSDLIVFAGYSLYDTDISRILGENPNLKEKTVAIQWKGLSNADERFLKHFGSVLKVGNEGLAEVISEVLTNGISATNVLGPENFEEVLLPAMPVAETITDRDVAALLIRGVYDRKLFWSSKLSPSREYVVNRAIAPNIVAALKNEGSSVVIHAQTGNGKTLVLEQIMFQLLSAGLRVFTFARRSDVFAFDIEFFSKLTDYVIVVEELIDNDDLLAPLFSQLSRARIVLTARSSAFEIKLTELRHVVPKSTVEFDVNKILEVDVAALIRILNSGAYWSNFPKAKTSSDKEKIIARDCRYEMQSVMLGVVGSVSADEKIRAYFGRGTNEGQPAIVLALIMNAIEMRPTYEFLSELLGFDVFKINSMIKDSYVREFFALSGIEVLARSPILARYVLKNIVSDLVIFDVLKRALATSSERFRRAERYRTFNSKVMQFSNIDSLIGVTKNKYLKIADFYDQVGNLGYKDFSPYYWLQYAIAASSFGDYTAANRYFMEAMKILDRRSDFYRYKIENSYAQFLIESRSKTNLWSDFFESFQKSSQLAMQQTYMKSTGNHPFKVVMLFPEFVEMRVIAFSKKQKEMTRAILIEWTKRIEELKAVRPSRMLTTARKSIFDCLEILDENDK
ncbi:hypothetical protein ACVIGB_002767 [Bradyrhizobium sp. USDA 4341]